MIIGTRGSKLALAQANIVAGLLRKNGIETTLHIIKTSGDVFVDRPLHEVGGVGAFVREIDERLLCSEIDIAVHSMKDMPTERSGELVIGAVMRRDSPYDVLLTRDGSKLEELPMQAVIGTTSLRRRAQLLRFKPLLSITNLRGNIDTRLRKLREGRYDGIMLAEAGLQRMGWKLKAERLSPDYFCPSANQGTIAIVTRKNSEAEEAVKILDHEKTRIETLVERIIINILGGGCLVPIGAFAQVEGDEIHVLAEVLSLDGKDYVKIDEYIPLLNYQVHAMGLGRELREKGGKELVLKAIQSRKYG